MKELEKTGREKAKSIQEKMKEKGIGFLILSQPKSFSHLLFTSIPFVCILRNDGEPEVFTHYDSVDIVREQSWIQAVNGIYPFNIGVNKKNKVQKNYKELTIEYIKSFPGDDQVVGMDFANTPASLLEFFQEKFKNYKILDFSTELNGIFSLHTDEELAMVKKAAEISETGVLKSKEFLRENEKLTENDIAAFAEYQMRKCNVDGFFVRSSVTSGYRTIQMGASDSMKYVNQNDIINVDYSPVHKGYFADICRPISKRQWSKKMRERLKVIEEALDLAIDSIKPGITANSIDSNIRKHFRDHGYDGAFIHHTGHPVGNSWGIMLTPDSSSIIDEGMVFAIEPGIYDKEVGGIRIEDNVYVTGDGAINLMSIPRIL